jgi:hypothetical protein
MSQPPVTPIFKRPWFIVALVLPFGLLVGGCGALVATALVMGPPSATVATAADPVGVVAATLPPPATAAPVTTEATTTTEAPATTAAPTTTRPRPRPVVKPKPKPKPKPRPVVTRPPAPDCHPSYGGACLDPDASDYDCAGGSGNGPEYVDGPITVSGPDPFDLDRDNDGVACET